MIQLLFFDGNVVNFTTFTLHWFNQFIRQQRVAVVQAVYLGRPVQRRIKPSYLMQLSPVQYAMCDVSVLMVCGLQIT